MDLMHHQIHGIPLGLPNEEGGPYIFDGTPIPPTPPTPVYSIKRKKFPWVLYSKKLRTKYNIDRL